MNETQPLETSKRTPKQQLALNVVAALRVAGPRNEQGKANKLRQVEVMSRTGMSRTTLRPLLNTTESIQRNPDFTTLHKLAQSIGVPLAFLLMAPEDWRVMIKAIGAINDYKAAANGLVTDELGNPELAEAVLKRCKVHPEPRPFGVTNTSQENERLEARNEWRRRSSLVMAALAQPAARGDRKFLVELTALAAALANEMTPYNPEPDNSSHNQ